MIGTYALSLLAISAFLSATLLPGSSETVLIGLLAAGQGTAIQLITAASIGNVAGSAVNWSLGRHFSAYAERSWFPLGRDASEKARRWFGRYGAWSLLFAWVPLIGDPLTLVAGILRVSFTRFLVLVATGKILRYSLIVWAWERLQVG